MKKFIFLSFPLVLFFTVWASFPYLTKGSTEIILNKTERVQQGDTQQFMVFSAERQFKNVDDIRVLKFNSGSIHGMLKPGSIYRVEYYGLRIPLLSVYPNITKVQEVR